MCGRSKIGWNYVLTYFITASLCFYFKEIPSRKEQLCLRTMYRFGENIDYNDALRCSVGVNGILRSLVVGSLQAGPAVPRDVETEFNKETVTHAIGRKHDQRNKVLVPCLVTIEDHGTHWRYRDDTSSYVASPYDTYGAVIVRGRIVPVPSLTSLKGIYILEITYTFFSLLRVILNFIVYMLNIFGSNILKHHLE